MKDPRSKLLWRALSLAGVAFFGLAALTAIRLAVAETFFRQDTLAAGRLAIAIQGSAPSEECTRRLPELDPDHAREDLEHIVHSVNSRSSAAWIDLGLLEDAAGDASAAERDLLTAARLDHQYLPAWTLANFYFRQGKRELFWPCAKRAALLSVSRLAYSDFQPLLQLCDQLEPNADRFLAHFADSNEARSIRPSYLHFLTVRNRLDAAQQVARGMFGDHANDPHLIDLADRQIRAGNSAAAIEVWNASSGFSPLDPESGKLLTNGDLIHAPLNLGFDWRLSQIDGVYVAWRPSELSFTFSGSQPEQCVLLEQAIFLTARHFRLRFDYTTGAMPSSGIHWSLNDAEGPGIEASQTWREGAFDIPRVPGLAHLRLVYRRERGTTRTQGRLELRNLRLEGRS